MTNMINKKYYKPNITKEWIRMSPFRYSFSDYDESVYTYRFPVYKSGIFTTLECELLLFDKSGKVAINVFEYGTRDKYAAFYCQDYGENKVLNSVNRNIEKEFEKLGIVKENISKRRQKNGNQI